MIEDFSGSNGGDPGNPWWCQYVTCEGAPGSPGTESGSGSGEAEMVPEMGEAAADRAAAVATEAAAAGTAPVKEVEAGRMYDRA